MLIAVKNLRTYLLGDWCGQGAELDVALTADDYQVTVDGMACPVVLLTSTLLSCRLDASTHIGGHRAAVKVLQQLWHHPLCSVSVFLYLFIYLFI